MQEEEAWQIVENVWAALQKDHDAKWKSEGGGLVPEMAYAEIKKGYAKDHRFYKALQTCLLSKNPQLSHVNGDPHNIWRLSVHGAPAHICEKRGVRLVENPYGSSMKRLWVYFRLRPRKSS